MGRVYTGPCPPKCRGQAPAEVLHWEPFWAVKVLTLSAMSPSPRGLCLCLGDGENSFWGKQSLFGGNFPTVDTAARNQDFLKQPQEEIRIFPGLLGLEMLPAHCQTPSLYACGLSDRSADSPDPSEADKCQWLNSVWNVSSPLSTSHLGTIDHLEIMGRGFSCLGRIEPEHSLSVSWGHAHKYPF